MKASINLLGERAAAPEPRDDEGLAPWQVAHALRAGLAVEERDFDRHLPVALRVVSGQYWTPCEVAQRAAQWFDELRVRTVVDIGSGAGKFCVAAALAGNARYVGLEHRLRLVTAARALADVFGVSDRVSFHHATFGDAAPPAADAYYLYNPFGENLFVNGEHLDHDVELTEPRYLRDVAAVEQLLRAAPLGTALLTYNGFGGRLPAGYEQVHVDRALPNILRLWRRGEGTQPGPLQLADD